MFCKELVLTWRLMSLLVILSALAATVKAQPPNYHDLGDFRGNREFTSPDIPISAGQTVWFRINLPDGVNPLVSWLDLDTSGPNGITNTQLGVYDKRANRVTTDNDSGGSSGPGRNGWAAAASIGGGSGRKLSGDDADFGGGRISEGAWVTTLTPGEYFIAVVGYAADFSQDPNVNWQVSTNSTAVGSVRLRVAFGQVPTTTWNERFRGSDAGDHPKTAQVVQGAGPLNQILTAFGPGGKDMFRIRITDPTRFRAAATLTEDGGGSFGGRLYAFRVDGTGVAAINNTSGARQTVLTLPAGTPEGDYLIAISSRCQGSPNDSLDRNLWTFGGANDNRVLIPNGPGAQSPMAYWVRQGDCDNVGTYFARIDLEGAAFVSSDACSSDFNTDGFVDFFDYLDFVQAFEEGC